MNIDEATYKHHTDSIQQSIVSILDSYGSKNPSMPLTCVLDALAETMVNISLQQMGTDKTIQYCEEILSSIRDKVN